MSWVSLNYLSTNKLTATLTKSSDGSAASGATVTLSIVGPAPSTTAVISGVTMTESTATSGSYLYTPGSTVLNQGARYHALVTAVDGLNQAYAEVPLLVVTDAD